MIYTKLYFTLFLLISCVATNATNLDSLLLEFDQVIDSRKEYTIAKERKIKEKETLFHIAHSKELQYSLSKSLYEEFLPYITDSAFFYAEKKLALALELNDKSLIDQAHIALARIQGTMGMYVESVQLLKSIKSNDLSKENQLNYYRVCRAVYGAMADYVTPERYKIKYKETTDLYRDSILSVTSKESSDHITAMADQLILKGSYQQAIDILEKQYNSFLPDSHARAMVAYRIYDAYSEMGMEDNALHYLILSANADIKSSIKEYISLTQLSLILYAKGDIKRAYRYLTVSMEDALFSNSRLRKIEVSNIYPLIDKAYRYQMDQQARKMNWFFIGIIILSVFLFVMFVYVYLQMKKLKHIRIELKKTNVQLQQSNIDLQHYIESQHELNRSIVETNHIKEEYIGYYMGLCSIYLEKLDNYRKSLCKIASNGKLEELYKTIKSSQFIDDELKDFYINFDVTFLRLFPNFVQQFNELLMDGESVVPKNEGQLTTELRIFALIRLGVTDSTKIAHFLRYSISTIYNYRVKMRNRAKGERDEFETNVMNIGLKE
jgi:hypothetical protein